MWELDYKESWVPKNWCFWTVVLEKTLESPLDCKEMKPVNPKGDQSWIFIGRTDVEAETLILWPPDAKSWLTWKDSEAGKDGKKAGGEGDDRGWDAWMASPTQWTCVWGNSRSCWWTGRPGVLQSMGSQRVSHNQATELNWTWSSFPIIYTRDYFFLVVMSWLLRQEVLVMYVSCISGLFVPLTYVSVFMLRLYGFESEKAMAPHSSTLAWKIPWTEEPVRLQTMGSLRVRHDWATSLSLFAFMHWRRKWQPTPVFLPGESQGRESLVGCHLWGRTESDTTEVT